MAGKIQVQRNVRFISKAGTFTAMLQSNRGQLWQSFLEGDNGSVGSIIPSFPDIQPELMFVVVSSRTNSTVTVSAMPQWYFGNVAINDGNTVRTSVSVNGQTVNLSEYFQLISPDSQNNQPYYGLKIKKNLVALALKTAVTIKAVGTLTGHNFSDEIQAEHTINIYPQTSSGAQIDVIDVTQVSTTPSIIGRNFTFTEDGQSITMQAKVYIGALSVAANTVAFQWQKIVNGAWANISGATNDTLTVTESQVETYGQYRVAVSRDGVLLGYGTASIMDATDPYILNPKPVRHTQADPTGTNGDGVEFLEDEGDYIRYTPMIVRRSAPQTSAVDGTPAFNFIFTDSAGASVAPGTGISLTGVTYADVTYAMGEAHGDINVVIETVQDVSQLH